MPEEQGNSLFSSLKKFLTDLSIEGGIKNVLSNADILANLPLPDLLDVILAAIVVVCYSAALPLLAYRPPWSSFVALAVAGAIMLLLVWRKRRRRIVTPKEGQKHLSRRQKLVIKAVLSGGIFLGIGYFGHFNFATS